MLKKIVTAAALTATLLGGTAIAVAQEKFVVGFPAGPLSPQFAYLAFGEELGYFKEEGLAIDYSIVTGSAILLPQVALGQVDVGYANPDLVAIAASKGEPLPVHFVMNWLRNQTFEFVVREHSPIKEIAELQGKKLGVGALTWGNIPLSRAILANAGITWGEEIEILPVGAGPAAWRQLETGSVDALNLFVQQHEKMQQAGIKIKRLPLPDQFRTIFSNGWVASNELIESHPKRIAGFGRALAKSWIACKANTEACVKAHWKHYPDEAPAIDKQAEQLKLAVQEAMFDAKNIDAFPDGGEQLYGRYPDESWTNLIEVMQSQGQIASKEIDLSQIYTNQFVEDYNKFDSAAVIETAKAAK